MDRRHQPLLLGDEDALARHRRPAVRWSCRAERAGAGAHDRGAGRTVSTEDGASVGFLTRLGDVGRGHWSCPSASGGSARPTALVAPLHEPFKAEPRLVRKLTRSGVTSAVGRRDAAAKNSALRADLLDGRRHVDCAAGKRRRVRRTFARWRLRRQAQRGSDHGVATRLLSMSVFVWQCVTSARPASPTKRAARASVVSCLFPNS